MDFIALTASVLLLGAMYIGTNSGPEDEPQPGYSEEVFVRKCANVRVEAGEAAIDNLRGGENVCS